MNYFVPIDNILAVKTNLKDFKWSYGLCMPQSTSEKFDNALIKIEIEVVGGRLWETPPSDEETGKFHYFSGNKKAGKIFYNRNFFFGRKLQYELSGLETNEIKIKVNKDYLRFVTHRFMNVHSVGYILTDIVNLKLLHNKLAPLHCSGIADETGSYLIFAPPNTGKTLSSMKLCMEDGYRFVAEDLAVTDGTQSHAVPWTSTFRYYSDVDNSKFSRFLNWLTEKVAVIELFGFGKIEPITKYVDEAKIAQVADVKGIFILERGSDSVADIDAQTAFNMCLNLDRYEFNYMRAPAIIAYEYFNPEANIQSALNTEQALLSQLMEKADFIKVVKNDNALNYSSAIKTVVSKVATS
ncbi:hypothetical protein [Psychrosphaera aestuarii]|uniref:hypothetical protein n=1 Tax=Psychrosphaera aestuarii TaxID=1266052 RepID=UPI001B31F816|nr:hypothetical protein [Psychrosphaera aestuarii]